MRFRDYSGELLSPRALTRQAAHLSHTHEACTPTHCHSTSLWAWLESESPKERTPRGQRRVLSAAPLAAGRSEAAGSQSIPETQDVPQWPREEIQERFLFQ